MMSCLFIQEKIFNVHIIVIGFRIYCKVPFAIAKLIVAFARDTLQKIVITWINNFNMQIAVCKESRMTGGIKKFILFYTYRLALPFNNKL